MSFEIGKQFKFESAHQLVHHDGKCARPHGHSYTFELIVEGGGVHLYGPKAGMVDDYSLLSEVGDWICDQLDHRDLNEVFDSDTTTAEEMSRLIFEMALSRLPRLVEVRMKETAKTFSSYRPARAAHRRAVEVGELVMDDLRQRLYEGINTSDPESCWLFTRGTDQDGYGYMSSVLAGTRKAHRLAAWLAGDDIEDKVVLHLCDTPSCVNPDHLYTGTHEENEADKDSKSRRPRGESHGRAKLNRLEVEEIVVLLDQGEKKTEIAWRFGVSTSLIYAIDRGRVWRHVTKRPRPQ